MSVAQIKAMASFVNHCDGHLCWTIKTLCNNCKTVWGRSIGSYSGACEVVIVPADYVDVERCPIYVVCHHGCRTVASSKTSVDTIYFFKVTSMLNPGNGRFKVEA
jgi:hypothetical protein